MATSIILPNFDSRFNNEIVNSKFLPKMKYDNSQYDSFEKENFEINSDIAKNVEKSKINHMSYLFPSVPIKVSINILIFIVDYRINIVKES
jgi:hypothetical protein